MFFSKKSNFFTKSVFSVNLFLPILLFSLLLRSCSARGAFCASRRRLSSRRFAAIGLFLVRSRGRLLRPSCALLTLALARSAFSACGTHQALLSVADQIGPSCLGQRLADEVGVLRTVILQKGALQLLLVVIGFSPGRLCCLIVH